MSRRVLDATADLRSEASPFTDSNRLHSVRQRLQQLVSEIDVAIATDPAGSGEAVARARHALAVLGLELEQHAAPVLVEIGRACRAAAGRDAVLMACEPARSVELDGSPRTLHGKAITHPSRYRVPAEYDA